MKSSRLLFSALLVHTSTAAPAADEMRFIRSSDQTLRLQITGQPVRDYAIQWSPSLLPDSWEFWKVGATAANGRLIFPDSLPIQEQPRMFFRAMPLAPFQTTTSLVSGLPDRSMVITLGTQGDAGPAGVVVRLEITALPAVGQLFQYDMTPITDVPALVTDPQGRVVFMPGAGMTGTPHDSLSYSVSREGGLAGEAQTVTINVPVPLHPIRATPAVELMEDTPKLFQLQATDPNPDNGGGPISFIIFFPTVMGRLYQVLDDDVTQGPVILSQSVVVTNPRGWLMYVPRSNTYGRGYDSLWYSARNAYSGWAPSYGTEGILLFHIEAVNDPPDAQDSTAWGSNLNSSSVSFSLSVTDIDHDPVSVVFDSLPPTGRIVTEGGTPIVTGQAYPGIYYRYEPEASTEPMGKYRYGVFGQFTFHGVDAAGAESAVRTATIRVIYDGTPPVLTSSPAKAITPADAFQAIYLNGVPSNTYACKLPIEVLQADGADWSMLIESLPEHGWLWSPFSSRALTADLLPFTFPPEYIFYVPDPDYQPGQPWSDSFRFKLQSGQDSSLRFESATYDYKITMNTVNQPPVAGVPEALFPETNGTYKLTGVTIDDDAFADNPNSSEKKLRVTLQAVDSKLPLHQAGGTIHIQPNVRYDLTRVNDGHVVLTLSPSIFSQLVSGGNLTFTPGGDRPADMLRIQVEDQGWTGGNVQTSALLSTMSFVRLEP